MSDIVLLILKVPESDCEGIALKRINGRLDVLSTEGHYSTINEEAADRAFLYASQTSKRLVILQILSSDLFHWGACDNILSGPAKARFIGHVREQLLDKSFETTEMLEDKGQEYNVSFEIKKIETGDPVFAALEEAHGDYDRIFIAKEKNKVFPLFKKTLGKHLRKKTSIPIIAG